MARDGLSHLPHLAPRAEQETSMARETEDANECLGTQVGMGKGGHPYDIRLYK